MQRASRYHPHLRLSARVASWLGVQGRRSMWTYYREERKDQAQAQGRARRGVAGASDDRHRETA